MSTSIPSARALARLGALLVAVLPVAAIGLPAARAATNPTANLTLAPGQSGSIGRVVSNTDVTAVSTCDPGLSVSFDATMAGTVTVAPTAVLGSYACTVDFQTSGQPTGLVEDVFVTVVPGLSINDRSVPEGSFDLPAGPAPAVAPESVVRITPVTFTVTMSEPSTSTVTVHAATADGTATAPSDYAAVDTTVTFSPGQTTGTVTVAVLHDDNVEPDETFSVNLSAPSGAAIVDGQGTCTILNDDPSGP